jgi:hypothetical protein
MKLGVGKYLGAAVLSVAFGLPGCTVETATSGLGVTSSSATTGSAGSTSSSSSTTTASSSGSAGAGGSSAASTTGAGGTATGGAGGSGGDSDASLDTGPITDASVDTAPAACFDEDADGGDAATSPCTALPYYATKCGDAADESPLGAAICDDLNGDLKAAAFRELFDCLKALPGADGGADACSAAHDTAAGQCSINIFNRSTCAVPDSSVDGGAYGCAQVAASCPSDGGTGGITIAQCQSWLAPFNALGRQGIIECYLDPMTPAGSSCADKFENQCVFGP